MSGTTAEQQFASRLRADPLFFVENVLGLRTWSKQRELLASVRDHRRNASKGGHACGKSVAAAAAAIWFNVTRPGSRVVLLSTSFQGACARIFGDVARLVRGSKVPLGADVRSSSIVFGPGWMVEVVSPDDSSGLQGRHSATGTLVVIDEAQGIAAELWEGAQALCTGEGDRILATGNPTSLTTPFHRCFTADRAAWRCLTFNSEALVEAIERGEEPALPGLCSRAFVEDSAKAWGRGSGLFAARVLGEFPAEGGEGLVSLAALERAAALEKPERELSQLALCVGVDVARFGSDDSVAVLVRDGRVADLRRWHGRDLMRTTGQVGELIREWMVPPDQVRVDSCGIGAGVVDRLQELGAYVHGVNNAEKPTGAWRELIGPAPVLNIRAEAYLALARAIDSGALIIPAERQELWGELTALRYDYASDGRLKIESKDELRARIGKSPDAADALALAFAPVPQPPTLMWLDSSEAPRW